MRTFADEKPFTAHLPAVQACSLISLRAVYSRTQLSAERLAQIALEPVDAYFDTPSLSGRSLDDLLDREDLDAVIIALPILVQSTVIWKVIRAGKHVLSEKPIAKDVETADELIRGYADVRDKQLWSVGENFRFLDSIAFGCHQIQEIGGDVVTFNVTIYGFMDENDKYYQTAW